MTKLISKIKIGTKDGDRVIPMRSPVSNFMYLFQGALLETSNANVIDTGNVARTCGAYYSVGNQWHWTGLNSILLPAYGVDTWGIQVGSNATGVALTDYKLNTQITHGTGGAQLIYGAQQTLFNLSSGNNRYWKLQRYFVNYSGGALTIREVGVVQRPTSAAGAVYNVLVCRDLTGDIVVPDTEAVTFEISWQISLS